MTPPPPDWGSLSCVLSYRRVHQAISISVEGFEDDERVGGSESSLSVSPLLERKRVAVVGVDDVPVFGDDRGAVVEAGTRSAHELGDALAARSELLDADDVIAVFVAEVPRWFEETRESFIKSGKNPLPIIDSSDSSGELAPVVFFEVENFDRLLPPRVDKPRFGGVGSRKAAQTEKCTCQLHFG